MKVIKHNQLLGVWVAILLKLFLRVPLYVRTGYDMYTFSKLMKVGKFKIILYYFLTQLALAFCNFYSVSSETDLNFLRKKFIFTKKIKIRKNSVDIKETKPFNKRKKNQIICIGRLEKQKNYEYIINEFSNSNIKIDIYGERSLRKDLEELIKHAAKEGLYTNLITSGVLVNEDRLKKLYDSGLDHVQISIQDTDPENSEKIAGFKGHNKKIEVCKWSKKVMKHLLITLSILSFE